MVRPEIVQRKLADLDGRVARVRAHRRASPDELTADRDALDLSTSCSRSRPPVISRRT
jgi:hypothetical protein